MISLSNFGSISLKSLAIYKNRDSGSGITLVGGGDVRNRWRYNCRMVQLRGCYSGDRRTGKLYNSVGGITPGLVQLTNG